LISSLSEEELRLLYERGIINDGAAIDCIDWDWTNRARKEQLPPTDDDWLVWLLLAGRGFGKTRTGAETVRALIESGGIRRVALVGPTAADVRSVMVEGESGLLSVFPSWNPPVYEPADFDVVMFLDIDDGEAVRVGIFGHVQRRPIAVGFQRPIRALAAARHVEPQNRSDLDH
jgi:hypothetical protein